MKKIISLALALLAVLSLCACGASQVSKEETTEAGIERTVVRFTLVSGETFDIELYPEYAPQTVANFLNLVNSGEYDGVIFHRVVDGFVAQTGAMTEDGRLKSSQRITGEMASNGYTANTLRHERGVVSMARIGNDYNSASNQFFICYGTASNLDGEYAAFGKVIDGMQVIDDFQKVDRVLGSDGLISAPVKPIVIEKAEVLRDA